MTVQPLAKKLIEELHATALKSLYDTDLREKLTATALQILRERAQYIPKFDVKIEHGTEPGDILITVREWPVVEFIVHLPRQCPGCRSSGFAISKLGHDRCTFCDGTEGGNPPTEEEIAEAQGRALEAAEQNIESLGSPT